MIVEHFHPDKIKAIYERFDEKGRILPNGVRYIDSWIDEGLGKCFQLMEAESRDLINEWINQWNDLVDFEVYLVIDSKLAREKAFSLH